MRNLTNTGECPPSISPEAKKKKNARDKAQNCTVAQNKIWWEKMEHLFDARKGKASRASARCPTAQPSCAGETQSSFGAAQMDQGTQVRAVPVEQGEPSIALLMLWETNHTCHTNSVEGQ